MFNNQNIALSVNSSQNYFEFQHVDARSICKDVENLKPGIFYTIDYELNPGTEFMVMNGFKILNYKNLSNRHVVFYSFMSIERLNN